MRLTTKTRYAITAVMDLAVRGSKRRLTLADISEKQGVSISYLEQLFAALRAKGLVKGVRGPGGGYVLGRHADEITIADVICAVDDWVEHTIERLKRSEPARSACTTRGLWEDLSMQTYEFFQSITLYDLIRRNEKRNTHPHQSSVDRNTIDAPALASVPTGVSGEVGRSLLF
jgi:Rrf2 family iron-sulfur cluster assembly transcriptional regulator